mgnify:CR=1 FL=1
MRFKAPVLVGKKSKFWSKLKFCVKNFRPNQNFGQKSQYDTK